MDLLIIIYSSVGNYICDVFIYDSGAGKVSGVLGINGIKSPLFPEPPDALLNVLKSSLLSSSSLCLR
jgi:hypothetical protein